MNGCIYQTDDERCMKFTNGKYQSWCVGKDAPCGYRVPSNGDRIRAMTDEDLAEYIDYHTAEAMWCKAPPDDCSPHEECVRCILDWLNSPVAPNES